MGGVWAERVGGLWGERGGVEWGGVAGWLNAWVRGCAGGCLGVSSVYLCVCVCENHITTSVLDQKVS